MDRDQYLKHVYELYPKAPPVFAGKERTYLGRDIAASPGFPLVKALLVGALLFGAESAHSLITRQTYEVTWPLLAALGGVYMAIKSPTEITLE